MEYYSQKIVSSGPAMSWSIYSIQWNELGELDSAKATYQKFVEVYPDNEMAESARTELANLGLSADEILAKQMEEKSK